MSQDKLNIIQPPIKKRGGKRPGAGRKVGSVNKIQGGDFLEEYRRTHGNTLQHDLVMDMHAARLRGDFEMLYKYQTAFAKYYFSDVTNIDMTSGGQPLQSVFQFIAQELPDWKKDK